MAWLEVWTKRILDNIDKVSDFLNSKSITWTLVTKILSGHKDVLSEILKSDVIKRTHSIGDSRISNLKTIKRIRPDAETMYIKPPAIRYVKDIVSYADISLNSSEETVKALNEEAKRQGKIHRIIIMLEMGELREGVIGENIISFYKSIFDLSNISVEGIGTNLGCMYGIEPTFDKLVQLSLYKQFLEALFKRDIPLLSAGSSITLPLVSSKKFPVKANHFRIGEAIFMGVSPLNGKKFKNLSTDAFRFYGNIVELEEKSMKPKGKMGDGSVGHVNDSASNLNEDKSNRAIVDFGILDVDPDTMKPVNNAVKFIGTTSDMTVYDVKDKKTHSGKQYRVGSRLGFKPSYMAVARLMNSRFIVKRVV